MPFAMPDLGPVMPEIVMTCLALLMLLSEARKSPLVWKTLTNTIKLSKQASLYSPVILKAAKDSNEWIRNLATEAINALGLEEK